MTTEPKAPLLQGLLQVLRSDGPLSPAQVQSRLKTSQSTLFRTVRSHPNELLALGARINRKIAALKSIRNLSARSPLFEITEEGEPRSIGEVLSIHPKQVVLIQAESSSRPILYPGLPYFLYDVRPQGFLGRIFRQEHIDLKLPARLADWTSDDYFESIARRGEDLTGNLLIGEESFKRFQQHKNSPHKYLLKPEEKKIQYPKCAQAALDGEYGGSSAGGEQPKFGALIEVKKKSYQRVLVKFSPLGDSFSAQRWRDLLYCEHLALQTLNEFQIQAVESDIFEFEGRVFLETARFDRIGAHGRRGVLTLGAFENEWVGRGENWAVSANELQRIGRLSEEDLESVLKLECFGRLIGNTDRHSGNLSFFWGLDRSKVRLAPVYDMLPMLYAPTSGGEDAKRTFSIPIYDHYLSKAWKIVWPITQQYWQKVEADSRISNEFRNLAQENLSRYKQSPSS